jgi:hypothetical protein
MLSIIAFFACLDVSDDDETLDPTTRNLPLKRSSAIAAYVVGAVGFAAGCISTIIAIYICRREAKNKCKVPEFDTEST